MQEFKSAILTKLLPRNKKEIKKNVPNSEYFDMIFISSNKAALILTDINNLFVVDKPITVYCILRFNWFLLIILNLFYQLF